MLSKTKLFLILCIPIYLKFFQCNKKYVLWYIIQLLKSKWTKIAWSVVFFPRHLQYFSHYSMKNKSSSWSRKFVFFVCSIKILKKIVKLRENKTALNWIQSSLLLTLKSQVQLFPLQIAVTEQPRNFKGSLDKIPQQHFAIEFPHPAEDSKQTQKN